MYGCESWTTKRTDCLRIEALKKKKKNWGFWIVVLEKVLESPLDCTEIKPVNPKGNQTCIFIERTVAGIDTLATWCEEPPTHWKDPDAGKDWRQKEKTAAEVR